MEVCTLWVLTLHSPLLYDSINCATRIPEHQQAAHQSGLFYSRNHAEAGREAASRPSDAALVRQRIPGPLCPVEKQGGGGVDEPCICCGLPFTDYHHWPRTRKFGTAVVPMCRRCHTAAHWGRKDTIDTIICKAPGYWRRVGEWETNADVFECWLSKRKYLEAVR